MLAVTESAVTEIRNLTEQPQAPHGAGLRIATEPDAQSLTLTLAAEPADGDAVVEADGARLFLDGGATVLLDDKTLDAAVAPDGRVEFALAEQG